MPVFAERFIGSQFPLERNVACSAIAPTLFAYDRILRRKLMTVNAMSPSPLHLDADASSMVRGLGDCLQMLRTDTISATAEMIPNFALGRFARQKMMCPTGSSIPIKGTVSTVKATTRPKPTRTEFGPLVGQRSISFDSFPEAFFKRFESLGIGVHRKEL